VTTEFAASEPRGTRNPWNLDHTPGGSSSGSAAAVGCGMVSAALGTQVIGSTIRPASFCGAFGFKPSVNALNREGCHDYQSQSATGVLAATLEDCWQVACEIVARVGGDAGTPGLFGTDRPLAPAKPRRLALLETPGWETATPGAREHLQEGVARIESAGVEIASRYDDPAIAAIERELQQAFPLSNRINGWETRWFMQGCRDRDAEKLSLLLRARLKESEALTLSDYRAALAERARIRARYGALAQSYQGCLTLSAAGAAPAGLQSTGSPQFAVPGSLLGVPAVSLPVFEIDAMPLGLQVIGFFNEDAAAFALCAWLLGQLSAPRPD
jgi:Asp-tRNA(Asn)/Glu-tRNA(Gln) amidotransferase A subunit family amidase